MSRNRVLPMTTAIAGLLLAACSSFGGGSSGDGTMIDRAAVDEALVDIAEDRLDGGSPHQGVVLEDECPVLGDASVADVVAESDVELDIGDERASGFLHAAGEGFTVQCASGAAGLNASISVVQTPAFTAAEFVDGVERFLPEDQAESTSFETGIEHPDFRPGSLAVRIEDDAEAAIWVDNGLVVTAVLRDGDRAIPRDDSLAVLSAARDTVLETLQGSTDGPGGEPGVAGGIDRDLLHEALDTVEPDVEGPQVEHFDDGPCPVLADEAFESVADELGWDVEPGFQGILFPTSRGVDCRWGEARDARNISLSLGRPVSVAEVKSFIEGPINDLEWTVEPLETSNDDLEGRSYVIDQDGGSAAGWVDNGLQVQIDLVDGDDAEEVLAEVIPAVLDELGLP